MLSPAIGAFRLCKDTPLRRLGEWLLRDEYFGPGPAADDADGFDMAYSRSRISVALP